MTTATSTFDLVPRSLAEQQDWLAARSGRLRGHRRRRRRRHRGRVRLTVAVQGPAAYSTTVEDSVYVDRERSGEGIGTTLLLELLEVARASGFHAVIARIEASGTASRALHARCGFELVGIEREVGRKFNRWLDVAVMQRLL